MLGGAGKARWRGWYDLVYPSLLEPGGMRGFEYKLRSIETAT